MSCSGRQRKLTRDTSRRAFLQRAGSGFGIAALTSLLPQSHSFAKAVFFGEEDLVLKSAAIAVIDLGTPVKNEENNDPFAPSPTLMPCTTKVPAKTIQRIAGDLPNTFTMYGDEIFICARCHLNKGRFLAFLCKEKEQWVGTNWDFSLRPVTDGKIEWYPQPSNPAGAITMVYQDSEAVLARVQAILAKRKEAKS
jgi:hypothetical protein